MRRTQPFTIDSNFYNPCPLPTMVTWQQKKERKREKEREKIRQDKSKARERERVREKNERIV